MRLIRPRAHSARLTFTFNYNYEKSLSSHPYAWVSNGEQERWPSGESGIGVSLRRGSCTSQLALCVGKAGAMLAGKTWELSRVLSQVPVSSGSPLSMLCSSIQQRFTELLFGPSTFLSISAHILILSWSHILGEAKPSSKYKGKMISWWEAPSGWAQ